MGWKLTFLYMEQAGAGHMPVCVLFSPSKGVACASPNPCWRPSPSPFYSNIHICYFSYSWDKIIYALTHEYYPGIPYSPVFLKDLCESSPRQSPCSAGWNYVLTPSGSNCWSTQVSGPFFSSVVPKSYQHLLVASRWACYLAWPFREKVAWLLTLE